MLLICPKQTKLAAIASTARLEYIPLSASMSFLRQTNRDEKTKPLAGGGRSGGVGSKELWP